MTVPAKQLTSRAKQQRMIAGGIPSQPAATLRAFVNALARLGYDEGALLAAAGVSPAHLDDPDGRVPCTSIPAAIGQAMRMRPLRNLGMRAASETPIGAFRL